jgi:hypothetical protein
VQRGDSRRQGDVHRRRHTVPTGRGRPPDGRRRGLLAPVPGLVPPQDLQQTLAQCLGVLSALVTTASPVRVAERQGGDAAWSGDVEDVGPDVGRLQQTEVPPGRAVRRDGHRPATARDRGEDVRQVQSATPRAHASAQL